MKPIDWLKCLLSIRVTTTRRAGVTRSSLLKYKKACGRPIRDAAASVVHPVNLRLNLGLRGKALHAGQGLIKRQHRGEKHRHSRRCLAQLLEHHCSRFGQRGRQPALTTVRTPRGSIGEASARMLLSLMRGEPVAHNCVDLGFELTVRSST